MDVIVYTFEARDRVNGHNPLPDYSTQDYEEAKRLAQENRLLLIENTYVFEDSQLLEDYAPKDWALVYDGDTAQIADRFATKEAAEADLAEHPSPGLAVLYLPDEGVI